MARTGTIDPEASSMLEKTVDATQQLVKLTQETGKQTKWIIRLTIISTILALIMAIPVIKDLRNGWEADQTK